MNENTERTAALGSDTSEAESNRKVESGEGGSESRTPPAPRLPQTSRAVMAGILGTLADVLDSSVENSKAALLDLQGVERLDCETYIKTATDLCKGMRSDSRKLEQEPSRIVKPGEAAAKPKRFVALSDAQALQMVRGGKG